MTLGFITYILSEYKCISINLELVAYQKDLRHSWVILLGLHYTFINNVEQGTKYKIS